MEESHSLWKKLLYCPDISVSLARQQQGEQAAAGWRRLFSVFWAQLRHLADITDAQNSDALQF